MDNKGMVFRIRKDQEEVDTPNMDQVSEVATEEPTKLAPEAFTGEAGGIKQEEAEQVSDSGIREVVLRGPIGHAYTEVLNHLLSKKKNKTGVIRNENMTQLMVSVMQDEEDPSDVNSEANKAYIFVNDGRKMNLGEIDDMVNNASKAKDNGAGYVGVTMEGMQQVFEDDATKASVISHQALHLESLGIPMFFTRDRTVSVIENWLGGK